MFASQVNILQLMSIPEFKHKIDIRTVDFKEIFNEYFPSLCVFVCKFVGDEDVAKDIVQDVFAKIWGAKKIFESEKSMRVYFYLAAKNTAIDYLKKEKKTKRFTDIADFNIEDDNVVINEIIREETYRLLSDALATLTPKAKDVIHLNLKGLSNKEIAFKLGVSVNTVKSHKLKAFRELRKILGYQYLILLSVGIIRFFE